MVKPDHITINVRDIKKSEEFYGDILGLKRLETVDMGDHKLHYYELLEGLMLELIEYDDDFGELHPHVKTRGIYRHLAFACDDVDALYEKLKSRGINVLQTPDDVPKLSFRNILVEDPNGVELEFVTRQ
ncbi:MAG: VOC family protein [Lachnospiraceae bacterium]|nr:VOC family protein [Lachnospiraceae bacterium]MBR1913692.1 VOC family protein [Lachnospiraceae bacterium]